MGKPSTSFEAIPDRLVAVVDGLIGFDAALMAINSVELAKRAFPRVTGFTANRFIAVHGAGYFGVLWGDPYVWFQERGIRAFTMKNLSGKTVPMWINDPYGKVEKENPKAKTRITMDGRRQTQIFRRSAEMGARKMAWRKRQGHMQLTSVPRSYPGAPGRIGVREIMNKPELGIRAGAIADGNVGVRWRHPGLPGSRPIETSIRICADTLGAAYEVRPYNGSRLIAVAE